jgi:hypothetical protein
MLRVLTLAHFSDLWYSGLSAVVQHCHQLEELSLCDCIQLGDSPARDIANYGKNLKVLNVVGCLNISVESIRLIGKRCRKLREVRTFPSGCHLQAESYYTNLLTVGARQPNEEGSPVSGGPVHAPWHQAAVDVVQSRVVLLSRRVYGEGELGSNKVMTENAPDSAAAAQSQPVGLVKVLLQTDFAQCHWSAYWVPEIVW